MVRKIFRTHLFMDYTIFRVENISSDILSISGVKMRQNEEVIMDYVYSKLKGFNSRNTTVKRLTWTQLQHVNISLAKKAYQMAEYYGYKYDEEGKYIPEKRTIKNYILDEFTKKNIKIRKEKAKLRRQQKKKRLRVQAEKSAKYGRKRQN